VLVEWVAVHAQGECVLASLGCSIASLSLRFSYCPPVGRSPLVSCAATVVGWQRWLRRSVGRNIHPCREGLVLSSPSPFGLAGRRRFGPAGVFWRTRINLPLLA